MRIGFPKHVSLPPLPVDKKDSSFVTRPYPVRNSLFTRFGGHRRISRVSTWCPTPCV